MQTAKRPQHSVTIEARAQAGRAPIEEICEFQKGARVFHSKFGYGHVMDADGNKLEIEFEKSGRKRVIATFVQPA